MRCRVHTTIAASCACACFCLGTAGFAGPGRPSPLIEIYWGQQDMDRGHWTGAVSHYRKALGGDPRRIDAYVGLGRAYRRLGNTTRARESFAAALRLNPHNDQAETGIHDVMSPQEHDQMLTDITSRVKNNPRDADLQTTYAEELLERDRFDEAETAAKTALQLKPQASHAEGVLGLIAAHRNQPLDAKRDLEAATQADPYDDDSWAGLGDLSMTEKDYAHAAEDYRHAVNVAPDHAEWHEKLATALAASGDSAGAAAETANAQSLDQAAKSAASAPVNP